MAEVELREVSKLFGKVEAVNNLSLVMPDGAFVTLLGPSGCGKTTTLNLIAGLEELTAGDIYLDGRRISCDPPGARQMAMVFQNYALYPHMNVFENISFGLRVRKLPDEEIRLRVNEVAELLGISDLLQRRPSELSGGQQQRVALGRAIARRPKVFLMDEPLSNLDAKLRLRMRFELKRLHLDQQTTTVYVTHDQAEAMTMSDLVAVLNNGYLQQYGTVHEIYNMPVNEFVAGFVGSPPMNFIAGDWTLGEGAFCIECPSLRLNLSHDLGRVVAPRAGSNKIVVGVRPEDVHPSGPEEAMVSGRVVVVEPLGSDDFLNVSCGDVFIKARVSPGHPYGVGDVIDLRFSPERIHFFDAVSGMRIGGGQPEAASD